MRDLNDSPESSNRSEREAKGSTAGDLAKIIVPGDNSLCLSLLHIF